MILVDKCQTKSFEDMNILITAILKCCIPPTNSSKLLCKTERRPRLSINSIAITTLLVLMHHSLSSTYEQFCSYTFSGLVLTSKQFLVVTGFGLTFSGSGWFGPRQVGPFTVRLRPIYAAVLCLVVN